MSSQRRIQQVLSHLTVAAASSIPSSSLETSDVAEAVFAPSAKTLAALKQKLPSIQIKEALPFSGVKVRPNLSFDQDKMYTELEEFYVDLRREAINFLAENPVFKEKHSLGKSIAEHRQVILDQIVAYAKASFYNFHDIYRDPLRWSTLLEILYYHSITLGTKFGVNFGLFGNTMMQIGSDHQRDCYAQQIADMTMLGGFALTELGHGSNARQIETTATYDHSSDCFILNTPTETAQKIFIGNLACHANHQAVFAQLHVNGEHHGVHVFLVRIREEDGSLSQGVRILDCGIKSGLNGVDNGRLWLQNKSIPRTNLLDRFGTVSPEGKYVSQIASKSKRFTAMIGALVGGRIVVAQGALNICKVGLTIAIHYSLTRAQFGPPGSNEQVCLADYLSHQRRLFPLLAKTYALQFAVNKLKARSCEIGSKEVHILAAALKPACTWHRGTTLRVCREACGGMGFLAANRIGVLMNDSDIDVTWEGDNVVLGQQVASALLKDVREKGIPGYLQLLLPKFDSNPLTSSNIRDSDFFNHAMKYREARILRELLSKLQRYSHLSSFEAWNKCLDIAHELSQAHVDRVVIEAFTEKVDNGDPQLRPILHALCSLHALWTIQENIGFFMTVKYFSQLKSKAIWNEINKLLASIRPHVRNLVDAFGIPENLIDAPIAGDWVKAYSYPNTPDNPN